MNSEKNFGFRKIVRAFIKMRPVILLMAADYTEDIVDDQ